MIRVAVAGIRGRVGQNVARVLHDAPDIDLAGGIIRPGSAPEPARSALAAVAPGWSGEIADHPAQILPDVDVLVDFTNPQATLPLAEACLEHGVALVSGTTGLEDDQLNRLEALASRIPVFYAANMSLGVSAILELLPSLAQALAEYDVEIIESHHRHKADAPSGTAYSLAHAIDPNGTAVLMHGRQGTTPRSDGEIGIHAVRAGGNHGEHSVILASEDEQVTISHRSFTRLAYARGALRAVRFIAGQPAGMYTTADLIG